MRALYFFASCLAQVNVKQKAQLQAQTTINWTNGELMRFFFVVGSEGNTNA